MTSGVRVVPGAGALVAHLGVGRLVPRGALRLLRRLEAWRVLVLLDDGVLRVWTGLGVDVGEVHLVVGGGVDGLVQALVDGDSLLVVVLAVVSDSAATLVLSLPLGLVELGLSNARSSILLVVLLARDVQRPVASGDGRVVGERLALRLRAGEGLVDGAGVDDHDLRWLLQLLPLLPLRLDGQFVCGGLLVLRLGLGLVVGLQKS